MKKVLLGFSVLAVSFTALAGGGGHHGNQA